MNTDNSVVKMLSSVDDDRFYSTFCELYSELKQNLKSEVTNNRFETVHLIRRFLKLELHSSSSEFLAQLASISKDLKNFFNENMAKMNYQVLGTLSETSTYSNYYSTAKENSETLLCFQDMFPLLGPHTSAISNIYPLISDAMDILNSTFKYCRDKATFYSAAASPMDEITNELFKQSNQLLFQCLDLISSMKIDCRNDADTKVLICILQSVFDLGTVVSNLELKTMAQLWKCLTSLLQTNAFAIRDQFSVHRIMQYLCAEIHEKIATMYEVSVKTRTITLKISNFMLKVIVKLCDCFKGYLQECFNDLCELILLLFKNSNTCSKYAKRNNEITTEIETSLLPAIDPLITMLMEEKGFVHHFLKLDSKCMDMANSVSKLLLLSAILKKLTLSPSDTRPMWLNQGFFEIIFQNISSHILILHFDIRIAVYSMSLQLPHEVYLYDAIVIHLASLIICAVSEHDFQIIESLLIQYLLRSPLPMKLFLCDLWCIITRYGNSDLRFEHTKLIVSLLRWLHGEKSETIVIKSLLRRFFKFLSRSQQQNIVKLIEDFSISVENFPAEMDMMVSICNDSFLKNLSDRTRMLSSQMSRIEIQDVDFLQNIEKICQVNERKFSFEQEITKYIYSLWNNLKTVDPSDCAVFLLTVHLLCNVSKVYEVNLVTVFPVLELLLSCESIFLKLVCLDFLKSLGHRTMDDQTAEKFTPTIASFFRSLMMDHNLLIQEHALETFSYFSHVTSNEKVIQTTIFNEPRIAENLTNFLQSKVTFSNCKIHFEDFLKNLFDPRQLNNQDSPRILHLKDSCEDHPSKKIKLDYNFDSETSEIELRIECLLNYVNTCPLSQNQKDRLKKIVDVVNELRHHF